MIESPVFGSLNWTVFVVYLVVIFIVGSMFARRQTTTREFFKSSGRMPWYVVSISVLVSLVSGIAFMSHPARVFQHDSVLLVYAVSVLLITPVVGYVLMPFYRKLDVTSAYEYLEKRFNLNVRLMASTLFVCKRLFWMALVALAPSLALSTFTGIPVIYCIMIIGITATIYTGLGGMSAVIWTDAIQFVILTAGQILIIVYAAGHLDGGVVEMYRVGFKTGTAWMSMDFDLSRLTMWTMLIAGTVIALGDMGSDQLIVQRLMATKDIQATRRTLWLNAGIKFPAMVLLLGVGVALFAFYHAYPDKLTAFEDGHYKYDQLVPYFVVHELPAGVGGLVIAAIFAAAMSSFDSGLNCLVAAFTVDWYERLIHPGQSDKQYLMLAKAMTFVVGVAVTALSILIYKAGIKSIVDTSNTYQGFFGGGLLGLFMLGVLTRRAKALPCVLAVIFSVLFVSVLHYIQQKMGVVWVHKYVFGVITFGLTMLIGYVGSLIGPTLPFEKVREYTMAKEG